MVRPVRSPVIKVGEAPGRITFVKIVTLLAFMDLAARISSGSTFWIPAMVVNKIGQNDDQKITVYMPPSPTPTMITKTGNRIYGGMLERNLVKGRRNTASFGTAPARIKPTGRARIVARIKPKNTLLRLMEM
ncbi:hypothetical protein D3C74_421970 [compost metagenome]